MVIGKECPSPDHTHTSKDWKLVLVDLMIDIAVHPRIEAAD